MSPFSRKILWSGLLAIFMAVLCGCPRSESGPIRIGFIGGLTGRTANLGIAGRDGVILAVEQVNRDGGINGRRIELLIRDDRQDEDAGLEAVRDLVAARVPAIIGPMTSAMAVIMAPVVNQSSTLMISPTVSTMALSGRDDHFFRVYPQCMEPAHALADYVVDDRSLRRFSVITDLGNRAFTQSWKNCFAERFTSRGGEIVATVSFTSGGRHRFTELAERALRGEPDGVLILANSLDTAMLAQQFMKKKADISIFTSEWSMTRDLLRSGGRSVEGITLFHTFNESSEEKSYLAFKQAYLDRFNQVPSFPAIHAYDAAQVLIAGLRSGARTGPELKQFLLRHQPLDTLQSTIRFDAHGDVKREMFLTVVRDGQFVVMRRVSPEEP